MAATTAQKQTANHIACPQAAGITKTQKNNDG